MKHFPLPLIAIAILASTSALLARAQAQDTSLGRQHYECSALLQDVDVAYGTRTHYGLSCLGTRCDVSRVEYSAPSWIAQVTGTYTLNETKTDQGNALTQINDKRLSSIDLELDHNRQSPILGFTYSDGTFDEEFCVKAD